MSKGKTPFPSARSPSGLSSLPPLVSSHCDRNARMALIEPSSTHLRNRNRVPSIRNEGGS